MTGDGSKASKFRYALKAFQLILKQEAQNQKESKFEKMFMKVLKTFLQAIEIGDPLITL